jgi:hypothetical protein
MMHGGNLKLIFYRLFGLARISSNPYRVQNNVPETSAYDAVLYYCLVG